MAIAFDSFSSQYSSSGTTVTQAHTCSGSQRILWVGIGNYNGSGGDSITGVTYNGVAMTQAIKKSPSATETIYLYYLINPDSGTHDVVATSSDSVDEFNLFITSFTGAKQSGVPDATANTGPTSGTSLTVSLTTIADNCWTIAMFNSNGAFMTASTGSYFRGTSNSNKMCFDSNGAKTPAGSTSMRITTSTSASLSAIIASFAPYIPSGPANLKSYNTNLKANIKSINTNLIANVKSLDTNV